MYELKGHEEPSAASTPEGRRARRESGSADLARAPARRRPSSSVVTTQPYTVIIGGGQGGIALGARLRQLGVPTIIIDRNPRPGDAWRNRYKSLCLHDPVWYDHLPYIDFPKNWPVFAPKDKIGDWLEMYAKVMELNYWGSTECKSATYDEATGEWTVVVERDGNRSPCVRSSWCWPPGCPARRTCRRFEGMDVFKGDQHHSSQHPGPDAYRGKRAVVIGANNSAHDICAALWEGGADVTMVQRSSTHIVKSDSLMTIALGGLYSEEALAAGMTTQKADLTFASLPYRIMHEFQIPVYDEIRKKDADFYSRLGAAGFMLDYGDDDSGLFMKYLRRGSGYYIDVGASELVASGDIKLESGVDVVRLTETRRGAVQRQGTAGRRRRVRDRLRLDERVGGRPDLPGRRRQGRQGLGSRLGHHQGPWSVGGRAAQHVEADAAGGAVVPRRQSAPVTALLAVSGAATQGPDGGHPDTGLRTAGRPPPPLNTASTISIDQGIEGVST